jgi:sulfotransferase
MKQFFFISGLPRSGTTLLSAILNQNPLFEASISGPLARFSRGVVVEQSSAQGGYRFQCDEAKRKKIILGMFDNYYDTPGKEVFFDTNRGWPLLLPMVKDLFPYTKMIMCVRDIKWVLDSFEVLMRKNPYTATQMFSPEENTNVYTRAQTLLRDDKTVGFALTAVKQAITSAEKNMIMLVEYDQLASKPDQTMKAVYKFIGQDYFQHDFDDVEYSNDEFDADVAIKGLHTTRKKVSFIARPTILPPDIISHVQHMNIWR